MPHICPYCGGEISDPEYLALRSDYESELNRIAEGILKNEGVICPVTAVKMAKRRIRPVVEG